jgi:hypothetical protein
MIAPFSEFFQLDLIHQTRDHDPAAAAMYNLVSQACKHKTQLSSSPPKVGIDLAMDQFMIRHGKH